MVKINFAAPAAPTPKITGPLQLTTAAATQLAKLIASKPNHFLRIKVLGGGCNGYSYSLKLDNSPQQDDDTLTHPNYKNEILARIDPQSHNLLQGSTLDFEETLEASRFIINNPNATSSCGCGNSFGL